VHRAENLITFTCRFSRNLGSLNLLEGSKPISNLFYLSIEDILEGDGNISTKER
jgi:hypothetical protein